MAMLHTIVSQETIKPSSKTPPHLKTHNLSILDHLAPNVHVPFIFFYKNYNQGDINILKKSLSECLTQYYPFAGRLLTPTSGPVDCNDEGVEFWEASHDSRLEDFIFKKEQDKTLYELIPKVVACPPDKTSPCLAKVQLNHFICGGVAMGVRISHKVADGFTIVNFINNWATVTRGGSPINPNFLSSPTVSNTKIPPEELVINSISKVKYVTRMFVFPNSKLNELKEKVSAMDITLTKPTRVEVLTSLIFRCVVDATTSKSGNFKPFNLSHTVNVRNKIIKNDPEKATGNIVTFVMAKMEDSREIRLNEVIAKLRKGKMELEGLRDVQEVAKQLAKTMSMIGGDPFQISLMSSSLCGFPLYEVDFGWGKPVEVIMPLENVASKVLMLIDCPYGDGIKAILNLPEEEMVIFQEDEQLLVYVDA